MISGECFCGAVKYEMASPLAKARCCHCSRCRKAFSGAGSAYAEVAAPDAFAWVQGRELLSTYLTHAPWGLQFCSRCGSTLCGVHDGVVHGVTLGSVNGDPGVQIEQHIFVDSRAPWDHIGGDAPQFSEHAP